MSSPAFKIGVAQFDAVAGDVAANAAAHVRLIDEAGGRGVNVLADAGPEQAAIAVAELDAQTLRQTRETLQMLEDRRPEPPPIQTTTAP